MAFYLGVITLFVCVLGGYMAMGGKLLVLWQPFEYVIILGGGFAAYIIGNPAHVLNKTGLNMRHIIARTPYTKENYVELLTVLYSVFKLAKAKGTLSLESHVENPEESPIFSRHPHFLSQHHALTFFCDYLRLITLGGDNPHQIDGLLELDVEVHEESAHELSHAVQLLADALPALGIVAAVLGVIKTMGSITEPPEVLGKLIGGALVGTFAGVFFSYGLFGPMAGALKAYHAEEHKYILCIKTGLMAFLNGFAPAICVEFARKSIIEEFRPSFYEVEEAVASQPNAG